MVYIYNKQSSQVQTKIFKAKFEEISKNQNVIRNYSMNIKNHFIF